MALTNSFVMAKSSCLLSVDPEVHEHQTSKAVTQTNAYVRFGGRDI